MEIVCCAAPCSSVPVTCTLALMPQLPEFWVKSLGFWALLVPVYVVLLGVFVWMLGFVAGVFLSLVFFGMSLVGTVAVETLLMWVTGPDVVGQGSYRSQALRSFAPWPLGITLACLLIGGWYKYREHSAGRRK